MEHLDDETLKAALAGDAAAREHFRSHLASACEVCERFVAEAPALHWLDGEVDRVLLRAGPPAALSADDLGFQRVMQRVRPSPWRELRAVALGLAACLVAVVGLTHRRAVDEGGVKGEAALAVSLTASARAPDGSLRRLTPGDAVGPEDVLLLRYDASDDARALLLEQRPDAEPQPLGSFPLAPGTHDLERSGALAGVRLDDAPGPVTVWLVAARREAPDFSDARAALRDGAHPLHAVAGFPVVLQPRHH